MKKTLICSLITVFLVMCFLPALVFGGSGVVRLNYVKSGVSFKIYKVGEMDSSGAFAVDDDFSGYGIDFENTEAAQTLAAYIERDNIPEEGSAATGSDSVVVFSGLESGYYLILGETYNDGDYIYTALPVMLTVYEGEVIEVSGKYEMTDLSSDNYQSISALKVWSGASLDSITVQLLRDGEVYDEQTLNSDGNWRYTWTGLDLVHTWTVTEKDIPSGYSLSIEKDGQVYILLNTKDSDTPQSGGETTTEAKTEATTEAKTETTTKKPSGGGGGGGGSVVVNPEETTEAAVETTTESDSESGTESETEEEEVTEEDVEDTTEKKNDDSDDDDSGDDDGSDDSGGEDNGGSDGGSDSNSEGATDENGVLINQSQIDDNSGTSSDSSASSSSASVSSDSSAASADSASSSSAGAASGASVSSGDSARLPQTGQLWFPVPILSCLGVFLLILGIGRRRMSE